MSGRVFATCNIGPEALDILRQKGYALEVYDHIEPPPRELVLERVKSGIDALVTTLRDRIDEEVFAAGRAAGLKIVAQMAVGFDNIDRAAANRHKIPFSNTADVLTDALILVGQHGVYCQSARLPGKPAMDIELISKGITDAKELIMGVMAELKSLSNKEAESR